MANKRDLERALAGDKNLREADLRGAFLNGAKLNRADLTGADLTDAHLTDAHLTGATLTGAKLNRATLYSAKFTDADLTRATLTYASIHRADLTRAKLNRAILRNAKLTRADLTGADLTGADLTDAILTAATLTDADLTRAKLPRAKLPRADLPRAKLEGAVLIEADLEGADLIEADLTNATLTGAILTNATLTRAVLIGATLNGATLNGADLTEATLTGANFYNADLTQADLTDADLTEADLTEADLNGAKGLKPRVSARGSAYGRASGAVLKLIAEGPQSAREYKRKYPGEFERLKSLTGGKDFDEKTIRTIVEKTRGARWIVTRQKYTSDTQRLCGNANDVLLLNIDLNAADLTVAQKESLRKLAEVSRRNGHPHETGSLFSVGWVRYCDGGKVWLVEEVQSDVEAARYGLKDEKTRAQLAEGGIDPESFEDAIAAIRPYTERFYEDALGITFALAKQRGIAVELIEYGYKLRKGIERNWWDDPKIEMDPKKRRKPPPERPYRELPRDMGMARRDRSEVLPDAPAWYYRPNPRRRARRKAR